MLSNYRIVPATSRKRRGAVAVTVALLLILIFAAIAFAIDIGWITLTRSQLQTTADSATSAAAGQLGENYAAYNIPLQPNKSKLVTTATSDALRYGTLYGSYNRAGNVHSPLILPTDVQFGFTDAGGKYTSSGFTGYPNTVKVVARRDSSANSPLPLFFAPVLGHKYKSLTATSSATIYSGLISGFDPNGGGVSRGGAFTVGSAAAKGTGSGTGSTAGSGNGIGSASGGASGSGSGSGGADGSGSGFGWGEGYGDASGDGFGCTLLPLAFDVNSWTDFLATGQSPDGTIYTNTDGAAQIQVYPNPKNSPGNFGLLCIGHWTNSQTDFADWILNGPSYSDLQTLADSGAFPVSQDSPRSWKGSPGLKSSLSKSFTDIVGQPRLLPLFTPASQNPYQAAAGNGSNTTYNIVGFVGVTVTQVTGNGGNLSISVQPCDVIDPTAVFDPSTVFPLGAEPSSQLRSFTRMPPKFTR